MKTPLAYQFSEYDCAPVTFLNAFRYLYDRSVTEPDMIKKIVQSSFDLADANGVAGKGGTSVCAVKQIADWLQTYSEERNLGFTCRFFSEELVDLERNQEIEKCLLNGGVAMTTVCITAGIYHYVLVTGIDDTDVYFFDSYYTEYTSQDDDIEDINDQPTRFNRKVKKERFIEEQELFYALGKIERRKLVLIQRTGFSDN